MAISMVRSSMTLTPEMERASPASFSSTPIMSPRYWSATGDSVSGLVARSSDHCTSWAVTGLPSWNTASGRRWKVYTRPSPLMSQLSARSGTMSRLGSMVTSPPNTSTMMRAEVASVVMCGSRVGGSTKSCTNLVVSPAALPSVEASCSAAAASVGAAVGAASVAGSAVASGAAESPPQAASSTSTANKPRIAMLFLKYAVFMPTILTSPSVRS